MEVIVNREVQDLIRVDGKAAMNGREGHRRH
jgi:hypothetical protein